MVPVASATPSGPAAERASSSAWRGSRTVREPRQALEEARAAAGTDGVALATGTIYLIADLLRPEGAERRSTL